jgi:hypothetical protein
LGSAGEVAPGSADLGPGPDGRDLAVDEDDDTIGLGEGGPLGGGADDRRTPLAQRRPQLDLGGGVEGAGDVVGQQQLGVGRERPGQGEPLDLSSREPDAAVTDQGVLAAGFGDVGA